MNGKRVMVYMPDALLDDLNRLTATSSQARSEIICDAIRAYLAERRGQSPLEHRAAKEEALFGGVADLMRDGVPSDDFGERGPDDQDPKGKLWIN